MGKRLRKLKKIRIHHEGRTTLIGLAIGLVLLNLLTFYAFGPWKLFCHIVLGVSIVLYAVVLNFFQCPVRRFADDTERTVVACCDGKVVVVEKVMEDEYFHEPRIMVSIFMSLFNVHNNWVPCDGTVKSVVHHDGRFKAAWLPKASTENERSSIVIATPEGKDILVRQVAGAMARRIVTYLRPGEECVVDEHLGFIKFGSRVDVYLPLDAKVQVEVGQKTTGNETVIATL
ncbi:MAG: phosphatidylserine decarboxylase family protein [Bacteroidaceae bacterium]|nr:phosphatidylserine decarboxylase family protein [Bacteroidaceae bacterium]MBR7052091.1 phosphatidylserine decarboxylase family protein [Bacteroidaceae bacterium]